MASYRAEWVSWMGYILRKFIMTLYSLLPLQLFIVATGNIYFCSINSIAIAILLLPVLGLKNKNLSVE